MGVGAGVGVGPGVLRLHMAVSVSVPAVQFLEPDSVYPTLHTGEHDFLLSRRKPQSPRPPLGMAAAALHVRMNTSIFCRPSVINREP